MAFDFPTSPTVGQVVNGYSWDGEKWKGGQIAGPQKEMFIDYSGLSVVDVAVPTWAKSCKVTAVIQPTSAGALYVRASCDGTTFLAGASDYAYNGPYHQMTGSQYLTVAITASSFWPLSGGSDNTTVPAIVTAEISLQRSNDAHFAFRTQGVSHHTTTAYMTNWYTGYLPGSVTGGALTIKALRFYNLTGKPGSYIHIKWLGDDAQIPISNAIPDSPMNGKAYVRVNGNWVDAATLFGPLPTAAASVGQWMTRNSTIGGALTAPAGGTWACIATGYVASTGLWAAAINSQVVAGGTQIFAATADRQWTATCWKIA